ncbi:abortive infection family protein [Escherichia coli]|uniref:abortive infection family protein n=1 Tax=Escherichia coli TaxID=562 RepID=UPI003209013F
MSPTGGFRYPAIPVQLVEPGVCIRTNDNVPGLLSLITAHLKDLPDDGRNEDVFKMLRSSAAILHGINNLRNNYSMAHPTETLLNEADARFAINLVRSIMTYVDELL